MKIFKLIPALFAMILLLHSCSKEFSVEEGGTNLPVGNWEFADSLKGYAGNIDSAYILTTATAKELHLDGKSNDGSQNFRMVLYGNSFDLGTYKASLFQSSFNYSTTAKTIYDANQLNGEFIVNITTINNSMIIGTFSGTAADSTNVPRTLKNGKFKATFGGQITGSPSSGILGETAGVCKPAVISGVYKQGAATTSANTVQMEVTVAIPGSYSISSNSVNGVTFSAKGTFVNAGVQNVTLVASGTPAFPGDQSYIVTYGTSQCGFTITYLAGTTVAGDYFPTTQNSNWTYGDNVSDSFSLKVLNYTTAFNGKSYQAIGTFRPVTASVATDTNYVRKPGGDYYTYVDYSSFLGFASIFDKSYFIDLVFLKDNVAKGTTWQSVTVNATVGGMPVSSYIKSTILDKAVPVTVGSLPFQDVIKVKNDMYMGGVVLGSVEIWYAKNVGQIYSKTTFSGLPDDIVQIGRYQVN